MQCMWENKKEKEVDQKRKKKKGRKHVLYMKRARMEGYRCGGDGDTGGQGGHTWEGVDVEAMAAQRGVEAAVVAWQGEGVMDTARREWARRQHAMKRGSHLAPFQKKEKYIPCK